jgi:hypothetical protein
MRRGQDEVSGLVCGWLLAIECGGQAIGMKQKTGKNVGQLLWSLPVVSGQPPSNQSPRKKNHASASHPEG